jgi:glyoxylase I family protein
LYGHAWFYSIVDGLRHELIIPVLELVMPLTVRGLCPLLCVFDMPASIYFYCEILGFALEHRSPTYATEEGVELFHWALLRNGEAALMLNTAYDEGERPQQPNAPRAAAHDDTQLYIGCPDVEGAFEYLRSKGVACKPPHVAPYGCGSYR